MAWYAVERRYRARDVVYVEADNSDHAKAKVRDTDYEYVTDAEPLPGRYSLHPQKRRGVPRWVWEEMGYPEDVAIDGGPDA